MPSSSTWTFRETPLLGKLLSPDAVSPAGEKKKKGGEEVATVMTDREDGKVFLRFIPCFMRCPSAPPFLLVVSCPAFYISVFPYLSNRALFPPSSSPQLGLNTDTEIDSTHRQHRQRHTIAA